MGKDERPMPVATYRLQLRREFGLGNAAALLDYLAALGVSHVYTSPVFQAAPCSTHGYDVAEYERVSAGLGGEAALRRFHDRLHDLGLAHLLDIVPNHMTTEMRNHWWRDVLENGQASRFAEFFDVDWESSSDGLTHKVLLPILADHYGVILRAGKVKLDRRGGAFLVRHEEHALPVAPEALHPVLARSAKAAGDAELGLIADILAVLPSPRQGTVEKERRHTLKTSVARRLARLCRGSAPVASALDAAVVRINRDPLKLDALLERQNYRLAFWRSAESDLNYRRFFNINKLVALRAEREEVYRATHRRVLEWARNGRIAALRVDHVDGLRDPRQYLDRLRVEIPSTWIVVEKVLMPDERLPDSWPVDGTTGYEFARLVNGLFVDPRGETPLADFYREFTGRPADFGPVCAESKRLVLDGFGGELTRLAGMLLESAHRRPMYRDYTAVEARRAVSALLIAWPVYRTYVRPADGAANAQDRAHVRRAVRDAARLAPEADTLLLDLAANVLLLRERGAPEEDFLLRFQQLTGAVMAKGAEDTAFYRYNRLVSLNEVGGAPDRFGVSVEEFHRAMQAARRRAPRSLLAGSTHDTKRGEDVRARINLISELPEAWREAVLRWRELTRELRRDDKPDADMEYLLYQNLLGAWPISPERFVAFAAKAAHEAKLFTRWSDPDETYDAALKSFTESMLRHDVFLGDFQAFLAPLVLPGRVNSLSQTLIRLLAPGVPDIYQGTELWENNLVDPDNRRPVNFESRRKLLAAMPRLGVRGVMRRMESGAPKLWLIRHALALRRRRPECFSPEAEYRPLECRGDKAGHVIAFARGEKVAAVTPRLVLSLGADWADTCVALPFRRWRNALTGERGTRSQARVGALFARFPVALLETEGA